MMKKSFMLTALLAFLGSPVHAGVLWTPVVPDDFQLPTSAAIEASAEVTVSDGKKYSASSSWKSPEIALFHLQYPEKRTTLGKHGQHFWSFDGQKQTDVSNEVNSFILGHQFHAELIFPRRFLASLEPEKKQSKLCQCWVQPGIDLTGDAVEYHFDKDSLRLHFKVKKSNAYGDIKVGYHDWRTNNRISLPYQIVINNSGKTFDYRFKDVALDESSQYRAYLPPMSDLTSHQQLLRLHQDSIDAHLASDARLMEHLWADKMTMVNRGRVDKITKDDAIAFMTGSLKSRTHSLYKDLALPLVVLSDDETLATVTARVKAKGHRLDKEGKKGEAFEFVSAWTSTFAKLDGHWKMVSNTSNFQ